jgi:signal transduction histidine kinase
VTSTLPAVRRLYRAPDQGLVAGVAAGIAGHLRVRVRIIRIAFIVLSFAGGLGLALYGTYWIVLPTEPGSKGETRLPKWLEIVIAAVVAAIIVLSVAYKSPLGTLFAPTLLACLGGALIWRQATDPERDRLRRLSRSSLSAGHAQRAGRLRLAAGAVFVISGGLIVLQRANFSALRDGFLAMIVTIIGLALVTGPWWIKLMVQLGAERSERIRNQERADIAAHLHDSVLQTLALIQRNAGSPREVSRLARGQERELRNLLYGTRTSSGQLAGELRVAAAEVEDAYAISVEVVLVGDAELNDGLAAAAAASREALVNAAKHGGVTTVSLYAEVEADAVSIFVKDRGVGFDLDAIAADRQGVRSSIIGRIERHGGEVMVRSQPGGGTEVEIRMPVKPAGE